MDCIFCKIVKGESPCYKIYEDADTLAFLSIAKDCYGHTLVVPKTHCVNLLDCPEKVMTAVMKTAQKISNHYVNKLGYDGANVFINNGAAADQTVFHLHVHIAPRTQGAEHRWGQGHIQRDFIAEQKKLSLN